MKPRAVSGKNIFQVCGLYCDLETLVISALVYGLTAHNSNFRLKGLVSLV